MKPRFDVSFHADAPTIEPHFCREWEQDENGVESGCYGTNPDHGYIFEDACAEVARWHEEQAALWRSGEHPDCLYYKEAEDSDAG